VRQRLEVLNLSHNQLETLPSSIGELKQLKELNVDHNVIAVLPDSFAGFSSLVLLQIRQNQLVTLPVSLLRDSSLCSLVMEGNPVSASQHYYDLPGFDEYLKRHKAVADKAIQAGLEVKPAWFSMN